MQCRSVTFAWHWDESGGECSNGAARKVICPGLGWSAKLHGGFRILASVILIHGYALASLPEARAGCSNPARPDPWRGLWATMIPTPTRWTCNSTNALRGLLSASDVSEVDFIVQSSFRAS